MTTSDSIRPLQINAGGLVPPDELVGREQLINSLLEYAALPNHGALLLGDRRIGKTSLLNAIQERLEQAGHLVIRVSAETDSLEKFGEGLVAAIRKNKRRKWALDLDGELKVNVGVASITVRGKTGRGVQEAEYDIFTLCGQAAQGSDPYRVIFLLDEITVLATQLARNDPAQAREFLRMLRRARQSPPHVAMFLSGSIGLHHALADDVEVNDLRKVPVEVLPHPTAVVLAKGLIRGAQLPVTSESDVADRMAALTSGFPYFVHGLAEQLHTQAGVVSERDVQDAFDKALADDVWNIRHYRTRIDDYYGPDADLVLAILDVIAANEQPLSLDALAETARVAEHNASRDDLLSLVGRLESDHYLRRIGNDDTMANGLIRTFWRHLRRLP